MIPTGANIKVERQPSEKVVSGIIVPDAAILTSQRWGVVVDGRGYIKDGSRVLFIEHKDQDIIPLRNVLYWK